MSVDNRYHRSTYYKWKGKYGGLEAFELRRVKEIAKLVREIHGAEVAEFEQELFKQSKRLADAVRALQTKVTKKIQNDERIAVNKMSRSKAGLRASSSPARDLLTLGSSPACIPP